MAGETLFDASSGMIAWRDFTLDGQLMVSAQEAGSSAEFFQTAAIQRVQEFPAPGDVPLTIAAQKAPKLAGAAPVLAEGLTLAPFAELGMQALFIAGMPDAAKPLSLPKTVVVARVFVAADGLPTAVKAFQGYAVLGGPTEEALAAARFPVRSAAYAVDVEVEWRP